MKKVMLVLCIITALPVIVYFGGGTPLLLEIAKNKTESVIQEQLDVPVRIGSLQGNIFHSVKITDIEIGKTATLERIKISYDLLKLFSKKVVINHLLIDGLKVDANQLDTLAHRLLDNAQAGEKKKPTEFTVHIEQVAIINSDISTIVLDKQINVAVEMKGQLLTDRLTVDTLVITSEHSNIGVCGSVLLDEGNDLDITYNVFLLLDEFAVGDTDLKGTVVGSGTVEGNAAAPLIKGTTKVNILYQGNSLKGTISSVWQTPDVENLNLDALLEVKTKSLNNRKKQKEQWYLTLNTRGRSVSCHVSSSYGVMNIKGTIIGDINNPTVFATMSGKGISSSFTPYIHGTIMYEKQKIHLNDMKVESRELVVSGNASISLKDPQKISAIVSSKCSDIAIVSDFIAIPSDLHGKLYASAKITGTIEDPISTGTIRLEELSAFNERIMRADFEITYRNSIFRINTGNINSSRGVVTVEGEYNLADNTFYARLKSGEIVVNAPEFFDQDTLMVSGNIGFDISVFGPVSNPEGEGIVVLRNLLYDTLNLGNYDLSIILKQGLAYIDMSKDDKTLHCVASMAIVSPYPFDVKIDLRHFDLEEYTAVQGAYISAQVSASGDVSNLENAQGKVLIDTVYAIVQQTTIQNTDAVNIVISEGMVDIISCVLSVHDQRLLLKGQIPFDLGNGNMNLAIESEAMEIADLVKIMPDVPIISGILEMNIKIQGQLRNPKVNGRIMFEHVKYSQADLVLDSISSQVLFQNHDVEIVYVKGKINQGTFNMNGSVTLTENGVDTANIDVIFDKIDVNNKAFGSAVFSGSMQASGRNEQVKIDGELIINKAIYDVPFNVQTIIQILTKVNQPPQEQLGILKTIYCNVDVSSPRGISIRNNIANVSAELDLQIKGYLSKINVYGTVATPRKGTVKYLGKKFDIESAVMQFDNPYEIDPVIDVSASHVISSTDGDYEIFMHVNGTLRDWRLELTSSPFIPEQDIISLLLIGKRRPSSQLTSDLNLKGTAKEYALGLARGTIERTAGRTLGVEKFTITGDLLKPTRLDIGIEKRLFNKITFIYSTGIESWELRRIGINYDLTDNLSIFTLHDQENLNSSIDLDLHFDIE